MTDTLNSNCCDQKAQQVISRVVRNSGLVEEIYPYVLKLKETLSFQPNGHGRRFASHVHIDNNFTKKIFSLFGIDIIHPEPLFGNFIGNHFLNGAAVHEHTDPGTPGFHHVRCNLALQMPTQGGHPVLNQKITQIYQNDIWICFASIEKHSSTEIADGQRLTLSLGALVEKQKAENVYKIVNQ